MMREIDALAHSLALETAIDGLLAATIPSVEAGVEWRQLSQLAEEVFRGELQYLEMRGALERHPSRANWLRIVYSPQQPGPVAGDPGEAGELE